MSKYDKILIFAEKNGYDLAPYQKELLKAFCENRKIIYPRQFGRRGIAELLVSYNNSRLLKEEGN